MRRITTTCAAVGLSLVLAAPAPAHRADLVNPSKAGPIRRGETSMTQMRRWFGAPTSRKIVRVGCVRVARLRWSDDLKVYAGRDDRRTVEAVFVRSRSLTSSEHGELNMHTGKGLRVDDRERKLRRLYPRIEGMTHAGHTHYRLRTGRFGTYVMAKAVDGRVVQLEVWPFEFC